MLVSGPLKKFYNLVEEKIEILTYCRAQYLVSRYGQREHEAFSHLHILLDPIAACSLSSTAQPTSWLS